MTFFIHTEYIVTFKSLYKEISYIVSSQYHVSKQTNRSLRQVRKVGLDGSGFSHIHDVSESYKCTRGIVAAGCTDPDRIETQIFNRAGREQGTVNKGTKNRVRTQEIRGAEESQVGFCCQVQTMTSRTLRQNW